jgi:hypothetical protein
MMSWRDVAFVVAMLVAIAFIMVRFLWPEWFIR